MTFSDRNVLSSSIFVVKFGRSGRVYVNIPCPRGKLAGIILKYLNTKKVYDGFLKSWKENTNQLIDKKKHTSTSANF